MLSSWKRQNNRFWVFSSPAGQKGRSGLKTNCRSQWEWASSRARARERLAKRRRIKPNLLTRPRQFAISLNPRWDFFQNWKHNPEISIENERLIGFIFRIVEKKPRPCRTQVLAEIWSSHLSVFQVIIYLLSCLLIFLQRVGCTPFSIHKLFKNSCMLHYF